MDTISREPQMRIDISDVKNVQSAASSDNDKTSSKVYNDIQDIISEVSYTYKLNSVIICYAPALTPIPYTSVTPNIKVVFVPGDVLTMRSVIDIMITKLTSAGFVVNDVPTANAMIITWG